MKYLHVEKADEKRVREALGRLAANTDWQYVREHLLGPTVARYDVVIRDMPHDDPQLPVFQGVARCAAELVQISGAGHGDQPKPSLTPHSFM